MEGNPQIADGTAEVRKKKRKRRLVEEGLGASAEGVGLGAGEVEVVDAAERVGGDGEDREGRRGSGRQRVTTSKVLEGRDGKGLRGMKKGDIKEGVGGGKAEEEGAPTKPRKGFKRVKRKGAGNREEQEAPGREPPRVDPERPPRSSKPDKEQLAAASKVGGYCVSGQECGIGIGGHMKQLFWV